MAQYIGTYAVDAQYRLTRRSRFDFSCYRLYRSSSAITNKEIQWGDSTIPVNTSASASFDNNIFRFSYGYSIMISPKYELGLIIGTHLIKNNVGISTNGQNSKGHTEGSFDITAPLPDLGIWGGYTFGKRWAATDEFYYFSLNINSFSGRLLAGLANIDFQMVKNLDLTLGYTFLNFNLNKVQNGKEAIFDWEYNGPSLGVSFSFGKKGWTD